MNILFISHKYPPSIGGMERQSYHLIEGMTKYANVYKIVYTGDEPKLMFYTKLKSRIKKMLAAHPEIEMIHCNDGPTALLCSWLKSYTDIPLTVTLHGLDVVFPHPMYQQKGLERIKKFDQIIAVSQATADACLERGFTPDQVSVVPNGVDHDLLEIPKDPNFGTYLKSNYEIDTTGKKVIVTVGRTVARKGFSWFIKNVMPLLDDDTIFLMIGPFNTEPDSTERVLQILPQKLSNDLQLMLGHPSDQPEIRAILQASKLKDRVFHLGKMPFKQMMQCLSFADLFVMPNLKVEGDFEGFGLVSLEAGLRGTPVLAANLEGIREAVHPGKNGALLPSGHPDIWTAAVKTILNQPELSKKKGKAAQQYIVETFSWDKMVDGYFRVFEKIADLVVVN